MSEPLLLLPGMMCDERLFAAQAAALDGALAWKALREETIEDMADAVLARAPDRFALAGLSMGGIVAMEIAGRAPERVARLALLDTNHLPEAPDRRAARTPQIEAALEGKLAAIMAEEMKPAYLAPNHPRTSEILALVRDMALDLGPEVFRAQSLALRDRPDQTKTLQGLAVPTLLLVGAHDRLCPPKRHEEMRALIAHADLVVVPDAGHLTPLEAPDAVTRALLAWRAEPQSAEA